VANVGRYELVRRIATGGMAEIYLARVTGTSNELVIKRILPAISRDPTFVEMFLAEARITAKLAHPNIVSVLEISDNPDDLFYAMEYVRGTDLLELVRALTKQHRTVPIECAVGIAIGVCSALEHAHALTDQHRRPLDIIHRDVSLGNILVGYDGSVKLADFGVVRHGGRAATEPGILKGKLGYMSPEQALGARLDRRSDLFALGIVLYEITTGERVFPPGDRDDAAALARIIRCAITPPSDLMFDYPLDFAAIVMTALAREPGDRYACARDMKRDLQAWLRVHDKSGSPRVIGELVTRTFPVASPRPKASDTAELDALVGSLPPLIPRTLSTDIVPVSPSDPAPPPSSERPSAPRRSRIPATVAIVCVVVGILGAAWAAWTHGYEPEPPPVLTAAAPPSPPVEIHEPTALQGAATASIAELAVRGAVPATIVTRDATRVLAALRACYRSPARDQGGDVEVAFDLVDTRFATRVGAKNLDRLAGCARRAAGLFDERAVVVTITFRPS